MIPTFHEWLVKPSPGLIATILPSPAGRKVEQRNLVIHCRNTLSHLYGQHLRKDGVSEVPEAVGVVVSGGAAQSDLGYEVCNAVDAVHQELQVIACREVAVKIDGS